MNKLEVGGILEDGYGIIPKKLMKSGLDKNIKLILCYMLSYTGSGDTCFPAIRTMAKDLKMAPSTVVKYVKKAAQMRLIEKSRLYPDNPLNHANKYKLLFLNDTRCFDNENPDVSTIETPMFRQLKQNINNINNNNINIYGEVHKIYPTRCVVSNRSLNRSSYNQKKLAALIGKHGIEYFTEVVGLYVADCRKTNTYMKDFKTFVNNFPSKEDFENYSQNSTYKDYTESKIQYENYAPVED